jgi:hypothetical protein
VSRNDDDDIASGNVWPEVDQDHVDWLEGRVSELEDQLEKAEQLLARHDALHTETLGTLDEVVARLTAEEHGLPVRQHPSHPNFGGHDA